MKNFTSYCVLLFILLSTQIGLAQSISSDTKEVEMWQMRNEQLKADILQDISQLKPKDQARQFAELGDILWDSNTKEGRKWLTLATDIALSPSTDYDNPKEKIDLLSNILVFNKVLRRNNYLTNRLLSNLKENLYSEIELKGTDDYEEKLKFLAGVFINYDRDFAFDLFMRSLDSNESTITFRSFNLFHEFKRIDEAFAQKFFDKLYEKTKINGSQKHIEKLVEFGFSYIDRKSVDPTFSRDQRIKVLDLLTLAIQKESKELLSNKRNDCKLTSRFGNDNRFKDLSAQHSIIFQQARDICSKSNIEPWRKPDFLKNKPRKTPQDYLNIANVIGDITLKSQYQVIAYSVANSNKDFALAVEILDKIDEQYREKPFHWDTFRIQTSSELIIKFAYEGKLTEIQQVINNAPNNIKPHIIIRANLGSGTFGTKHKEFALNLLNQAKIELNKRNFSAPKSRAVGANNPANYIVLVARYFDLGHRDEALQTLDESISFLNLLSKEYILEDKDGKKYTYFNYYTLRQRLRGNNYGRVYNSFSNIKSIPIRLHFKLNLLNDNLHLNSYSTSSGTIQINQ